MIDQPPQLVEPLERIDQVAVERVAAHLAIGDHVEAGRVLQGDRFVDGAVLDGLELRGVISPRACRPRASIRNAGPQEAADDVTPHESQVPSLKSQVPSP